MRAAVKMSDQGMMHVERDPGRGVVELGDGAAWLRGAHPR